MRIIKLDEALDPHKNYRLRGGKFGSVLGQITMSAARNQTLWKVIQHLLPEDLRSNLVAVSTKGQKLVLHVSSSAWATRLTFAGPGLLKKLQRLQDYQDLTEVSIVIGNR